MKTNIVPIPLFGFAPSSGPRNIEAIRYLNENTDKATIELTEEDAIALLRELRYLQSFHEETRARDRGVRMNEYERAIARDPFFRPPTRIDTEPPRAYRPWGRVGEEEV